MKYLFSNLNRSLLQLLVLACCLSTAHSQQPRSEQRTFGVEEAFEHATVVPPAALQAIQGAKESAEIMRDCAHQEGIRVGEIPASWFVGSTVELSGRNSSGIVVRGENRCLLGAHITQFWLLAKSREGYTCVFTGRADGLKLLSRRTNGYRDVQLVFIMKAGAQVQYVTFRFANGAYHMSESRTDNTNQP